MINLFKNIGKKFIKMRVDVGFVRIYNIREGIIRKLI